MVVDLATGSVCFVRFTFRSARDGGEIMWKVMKFSALFSTVLALGLLFTAQGFGEKLFSDNFEQDVIGKEPSKWEPREGDHTARVIEDPTDPDNKVFEATNRLNGSNAGRYYVAGDESWTDYIFEWDWMIFADGYRGMAFRFQDRSDYYLVDRRMGGVQIELYSRKSASWALMDSGDYPNDVNVWYRCRLEVIGDNFKFKIKERDDDTPFSEMEPLLEATDSAFESGGIANGGIAYIDNVIVGETESDLILAVRAIGKLPVIWGKIKTEY
jgi:hypothetical protein